MKNAVKMLLCLLMCLMVLSFACAQGVECAGKLVELENLQHYPSYTCDEETGKWSVHAYQADALMEDGCILAGAGAPLARLADFACKNSLTGLEFAHGIPGTVGGAVCMNAGAYDGEMKQVLESVTALFPEEGVRTLSLKELDLSYRHSLFTDRPDGVVLSAVFRLTAGDPETIRARMAELMQRRKTSQPLEYPSAGSTFKRPAGHFAGTLIDQCGLKGLTVGGAQVSEKHAGFLINRGGATCADVLELIRQVQERVASETGVRLEPEVRIIR